MREPHREAHPARGRVRSKLAQDDLSRALTIPRWFSLLILRGLVYNRSVKRSRTIWIATMLALLLAAIVPQAEAVWQCDGRTCGTAQCCCVSPNGAKDRNCKASTGPVSGADGCTSNCRCVLVDQALHTARTERVSRF